MRIGEGKCSKCETVTKLIKGMCQRHYQQKNNKRYNKMKTKKPIVIVKKTVRKVKGYALLVNGKLDINYDIYTRPELAVATLPSYRHGINSKTEIVPCTITYSVNAKRVKETRHPNGKI